MVWSQTALTEMPLRHESAGRRSQSYWLLSRLFPRGTGYSAPAQWAPPASSAPLETPLDILKRRYASGEITKAEYDQMRQDILADSR